MNPPPCGVIPNPAGGGELGEEGDKAAPLESPGLTTGNGLNSGEVESDVVFGLVGEGRIKGLLGLVGHPEKLHG